MDDNVRPATAGVGNRKEIEVVRVSEREIVEKNRMGVCFGGFSIEGGRVVEDGNTGSQDTGATVLKINEKETGRYNTEGRLFDGQGFGDCVVLKAQKGKPKVKPEKEQEKEEDEGTEH